MMRDKERKGRDRGERGGKKVYRSEEGQKGLVRDRSVREGWLMKRGEGANSCGYESKNLGILPSNIIMVRVNKNLTWLTSQK